MALTTGRMDPKGMNFAGMPPAARGEGAGHQSPGGISLHTVEAPSPWSELTSADPSLSGQSTFVPDRTRSGLLRGNVDDRFGLDLPEELEYTPFTCSNQPTELPVPRVVDLGGLVAAQSVQQALTASALVPVALGSAANEVRRRWAASPRSYAVGSGIGVVGLVSILAAPALVQRGSPGLLQAGHHSWSLLLRHCFHVGEGAGSARADLNGPGSLGSYPDGPPSVWMISPRPRGPTTPPSKTRRRARSPPSSNYTWIRQEASTGPKSAICNPAVPVPRPSPHKWALKDAWRRSCEQKNRNGDYPFDRNWCWVGYKRMCHWNLKSHWSWTEIQHKAAEIGIAPPVADEPFSPLERPELCDVASRGIIRKWSAAEYARSREWFKNNVAVYVLSLPSSEKRWQMIKSRLDELEIWATRVPGVDMRAPGALWLAKEAGFIPKGFNFTRAQSAASAWKHSMGGILGTMGCAAAHFKVQKQVIADGMPLAVVLEDDSWPTLDFVPRLHSLVLEELPCDWEIVALLSRCAYGTCVSPHLVRVQPDINEPEWRCHQGVNWGMHAMLYRTEKLARLQKRWQRVVFDEERPRCMDVDVALASLSERTGYYAVPHVQDPGFVSESDHRSTRWDINQAQEA